MLVPVLDALQLICTDQAGPPDVPMEAVVGVPCGPAPRSAVLNMYNFQGIEPLEAKFAVLWEIAGELTKAKV